MNEVTLKTAFNHWIGRVNEGVDNKFLAKSIKFEDWKIYLNFSIKLKILIGSFLKYFRCDFLQFLNTNKFQKMVKNRNLSIFLLNFLIKIFIFWLFSKSQVKPQKRLADVLVKNIKRRQQSSLQFYQKQLHLPTKWDFCLQLHTFKHNRQNTFSKNKKRWKL